MCTAAWVFLHPLSFPVVNLIHRHMLQALRVQYDALKTLASNTQAQLQSTKAQLQHAETASLQAQQQIMHAETAAKTYQHSTEVAEEQCRQLR